MKNRVFDGCDVLSKEQNRDRPSRSRFHEVVAGRDRHRGIVFSARRHLPIVLALFLIRSRSAGEFAPAMAFTALSSNIGLRNSYLRHCFPAQHHGFEPATTIHQ